MHISSIDLVEDKLAEALRDCVLSAPDRELQLCITPPTKAMQHLHPAMNGHLLLVPGKVPQARLYQNSVRSNMGYALCESVQESLASCKVEMIEKEQAVTQDEDATR